MDDSDIRFDLVLDPGNHRDQVGTDHTTVPLDQAPVPTSELCGMKIHGSASGDTGGRSNP